MNANVISMTPKRIILDAKNGTSLEEAIKKYGYNSKEELRSAIYHFFPKDNKGREIWRKLTENSKKKVREKGRKDSNHIEMNGNGQNTGTDVLHDALGKNEPENVTLDKNSRKKALAHKEELLSKEVRDLEMRHKKICQEHMLLRKNLRPMVDTLNNMLGELKQIRSEIAECERKSNDLISNMSAISAQKAKYVSELERIRQEIAELRKVTVYCCANGQVDVENAEIPTDLVSDEEIKNKAKQLFAKAIDEGIDVNVKEVHALAILFYIIAYLNRSKLPWECAFDNENMEALFED